MPVPFKTLCRYFIILAPVTWACHAQDQPNINADLPKISPPSPTVAALMKFEEVPVDNYTGIPDISIPLYSIQSRSKDIAVNLSLNYHPSSIAASEVASYVGLGWNLMGSGTISRTVKGYPDELNENDRIGIYQNTTAASYQKNIYYDVRASVLNNTAINQEEHNNYMYGASEKGKFDTEQDLYQFNFLGHSGRFYIKKDGNTFSIIRLDNTDNLKITVNMNTTTYKVNFFEVRDDKGNKYRFDIKEVTTETGSSPAGPSGTLIYYSAFHLSQITDNNEKVLVTYTYNFTDSSPITCKERVISSSTKDYYLPSVNSILPVLNLYCDNTHLLLPPHTYSTSMRDTETQKLTKITVEGKAIIEFVLENGRHDKDNSGNYRLKGIQVKDHTGVGVKKYEFIHDYATVADESVNSNFGKRMVLKKLTEGNFNDTSTQDHTFYYKTINNYDEASVYMDYWGYYNYRPSCAVGYYRETTPGFVTMDVLQKITLPTGGCKIFDFESNTYSYVGNEAVTNFDDNPMNYDDELVEIAFSSASSDNSQTIEILQEPGQWACVSFYTSWNCTYPSYDIGLYDYDVSTIHPVISYACYPTDGQIQEVGSMSQHVFIPTGTYHLKVNSVVTQPGQNCVTPQHASVSVVKANRKQFIQKWLYGGGVRIKRIGYFDQDVDPDYYSVPGQLPLPAKEKNYNYQFFDDSSKSSGSLVFAKPLYSYDQTIRILSECGAPPNTHGSIVECIYTITTNQNNRMAQKTRGADVGYKNVTVSEAGIGNSKYTYTSPIDVPEDTYINTYPFFPTKNYDYKRGLLQNEKVFHNNGRILLETDYKYEIDSLQDITGFRYYSPLNCPLTSKFNLYGAYKEYVDNCPPDSSSGASMLCELCGYVYQFVSRVPIYEAFGWAKLKEKTNKEYFYTEDNTQKILRTNEQYTYNALNKKLASYTKETYGTSEKIKSEYTYFNDPASWDNNRIGEILQVKDYVNTNLVSTKQIDYDPTNLLPGTILQSKGSNPVEAEIQFTLYDAYSNPLEVKQVDGVTISYIYGYKGTQPVAMIENATYAQISAVITGVSLATLKLGDNEGYMSQIDGLRVSLPNARITTYEYKPLVGVKKVTDPRGYITTYDYDNFGRLKWVKDAVGNLLSENEYKYKSQNP